MCCSLETFGYRSETQKNFFKFTAVSAALGAIAGVALGVMAMYGAISAHTALWTQVGVFGGVAILAGLTVAISSKVKSKSMVAMAVISLLALPVLFGSLGATHVIPSGNMLWAATMMCGAVVMGSFFISMCGIARECCGKEDRYR